MTAACVPGTASDRLGSMETIRSGQIFALYLFDVAEAVRVAAVLLVGKLTKGLGAGADPNVGRSAALVDSSASTIPRVVSARFVPVSPSGTG